MYSLALYEDMFDTFIACAIIEIQTRRLYGLGFGIKHELSIVKNG